MPIFEFESRNYKITVDIDIETIEGESWDDFQQIKIESLFMDFWIYKKIGEHKALIKKSPFAIFDGNFSEILKKTELGYIIVKNAQWNNWNAMTYFTKRQFEKVYKMAKREGKEMVMADMYIQKDRVKEVLLNLNLLNDRGYKFMDISRPLIRPLVKKYYESLLAKLNKDNER